MERPSARLLLGNWVQKDLSGLEAIENAKAASNEDIYSCRDCREVHLFTSNVQSPSEKPSNLACESTLFGNAPRNQCYLTRRFGFPVVIDCARKVKCPNSQEVKPRGTVVAR